MEKEVVEKFLGNKVKLLKRAGDRNDPKRTTFKIFCEIREVTNGSVIIFTDHIGVLMLDDIVGIEELS